MNLGFDACISRSQEGKESFLFVSDPVVAEGSLPLASSSKASEGIELTPKSMHDTSSESDSTSLLPNACVGESESAFCVTEV